MKFELKSYNWGLSDEELLNDLRSVATRLNKDFVTKDEYDKHGRLCPATFQNRFGSWGRANELAGLKRIRNFQATREDGVKDIRRVAEALKKDSITANEYEKHGRFSLPVIYTRVGLWEKAVSEAGLVLSLLHPRTITEEQLFENLEQLWEKLGRQPSKNDFFKPHSRYSYAPYPRRFGSYRKALEAFVASFEEHGDKAAEDDSRQETPSGHAAPQSLGIHRTPRSISWRKRFLVMRRDDFKCRLCGISPATQPGTVLVVDHIVPWASGGETVLENLQTLCEPCNGGKSNLCLLKKGNG